MQDCGQRLFGQSTQEDQIDGGIYVPVCDHSHQPHHSAPFVYLRKLCWEFDAMRKNLCIVDVSRAIVRKDITSRNAKAAQIDNGPVSLPHDFFGFDTCVFDYQAVVNFACANHCFLFGQNITHCNCISLDFYTIYQTWPRAFRCTDN